MLGVIAIEKFRGWDERDESAVSEDDEPLITDNRRPWSLKYMGNVTAASIAWCAAAFVLVYGKTLDWFHSPKITVACALFFVFLFDRLIDLSVPDQAQPRLLSSSSSFFRKDASISACSFSARRILFSARSFSSSDISSNGFDLPRLS